MGQALNRRPSLHPATAACVNEGLPDAAFPHHYSVLASAATQGDVTLAGDRRPGIPSAPPTEFGGPGDRWSPETRFVAAVADCFVLTFRGIAGVSRFPWVSLECNVTGTVGVRGRVKTVIFACVHNAGRSQMAAALFNTLADPSKARAVSAGTAPGERAYPEVVAVMREEGIDLGNVRPQKLTAELAAGAQLLVTMGCGDECPYIRGVRRDDWPLEAPRGKPIECIRAIRDDIRARVDALILREASR